jgi:predicted ABC-type sugar transport system permease subunit
MAQYTFDYDFVSYKPHSNRGLLVKDLILMSQNMSYILVEVEYFAQYILHIKIMIIWYILLGYFDI